MGTYAWSNLWIFPKHTLDDPAAERKGYDILSRNQNLNMNDSGNMTYNGPVYMVGSGDTIDLFILLIRPCISCS